MWRWATFDCYGTLIDWNGGIGRELERLFGPDRAGERLRRYHELEPEIQREDPSRSYRDVMAIALARLGAACDARYYRGGTHAFMALVWQARARQCWRDTFDFLATLATPPRL